MLTGLAAGLATWWYRSQQQMQRPIPVDRGEVIFRNAPLSSTGE
jgi:hypothetical protein